MKLLKIKLLNKIYKFLSQYIDKLLVVIILLIIIYIVYKNKYNVYNQENMENKTTEAINKLKEIGDALDNVQLKDDDLNEVDDIKGDYENNSKDREYDITGNKTKQALQKDTFELLSGLNDLKAQIESIGPVLLEGKKIMSMFENFKL